MKEINILSIVEAYRNLDKMLFTEFTKSLEISSGVKDYELDGLESLARKLLTINGNISVLMHYYLGYSIPQIGKEFDLLRFGTEAVINIEIKTECSLDKVIKQQKRNRYYLSFLGKELLIYTYLSKTDKLYKLISGTDGDTLMEVPVKELHYKLSNQEIDNIKDINSYFNPSDYLVSPFNSTDKFIENKYFLTVQQENIYNEICVKLEDNNTQFIALTGSAGTGKTLLTYHIAKHAMNSGRKVLILHCGPLNGGHMILREQYGWEINMPRYAPEITDFDILIIDETQRMYPSQFTNFVKIVRQHKLKCIFSFDGNQYLRDTERCNAITQRIEKELLCTPYKLTDKIRTNKEIAYFIKQLFNSSMNIPNMSYANIELSYCQNYDSARSLLNHLSREGWKTPNYTPGTRSSFHYENYSSSDRDSAHSVVGQEFDKVAVVLDNCFRYDDDGNLSANNAYYSQRQMLYQIITRTRKQLYVIIINNVIILRRIIGIMQQ